MNGLHGRGHEVSSCARKILAKRNLIPHGYHAQYPVPKATGLARLAGRSAVRSKTHHQASECSVLYTRANLS